MTMGNRGELVAWVSSPFYIVRVPHREKHTSFDSSIIHQRCQEGEGKLFFFSSSSRIGKP
jgi:hypothetical protein